MSLFWWCVGIIAAHQGITSLRQGMESSAKYRDAQDYAHAVNKPMLVVGGPYGNSTLKHILDIKAHGYGDVCVDIDPSACAGGNYVPGSVTSIPYPDHTFGSAFCAHVLEHMPDIETLDMAWKELHRVADRVYICVPGKDAIMGWLTEGHCLWINQLDDNTLEAEERNPPYRTMLVTVHQSPAYLSIPVTP